MSSDSINLSWLTRPVENSETEPTTTTTKITGDNDIDQKINDYFNRHKKADKASNPTDTLAEVYAKYDKNHDGKLDRSERKAAGMTRSEARAFNKAMKAFGGDDGNIKSYALDDGSGTMYYNNQNGKFLFSIRSQDGKTVTTLYDDNNQPKTVTTENENYTKTEEFGTDGKPQKTTIKYTDAYSSAYNGVTEEIYEDYTEGENDSLFGKVTTCYGKAKRVVDYTNKDYIVTTYEGDLPEGVKEKSGDKTVTKKQEFLNKNTTILTFEDGTQQEEVIADDGKTKTVTTKDKDGNVTETKTYNKSDTGEWEEVTEAPEPEEKPEEETGQKAALDALKAGFTEGNEISVTIQGGQTKLSSGDYQGTINLPAGQTFEEGKMPQTLFMTLPQGSTGKMKLTYDESTGLYTTTRGDRQFRITADNGKITMKAFTDDPEVQQKLNRNIDEYKTKIDLSKSYTAWKVRVNDKLEVANDNDWSTEILTHATQKQVQQYFDLSSVCLADAANMDKDKLTMTKNSRNRTMFATLPDGRWIKACYKDNGELKEIVVSFNNAKNYNVGENKKDWNETTFNENYAYAYLAHDQGENDYCISGDAYSFDNIKAVALKIFPETWPEN